MYHFIFTILILIDGQVVQFKVKLSHAFITVIYGIIYSIFTIVYYACGGKSLLGEENLYPLLNWGENPGVAVAACFGATMFGAFARVLSYLLYKLRLYIYRKVRKQKITVGNISDEKRENDGIKSSTEENSNKVVSSKTAENKISAKVKNESSNIV